MTEGTSTETKEECVDMQPDDRAPCPDLRQKLANSSTENSKCRIYKLHAHLRNVNEKAYEPHILAIGPYHHDKDNTQMMEEHKFLYLQSLLKRKNEKVEKYVSAIREMEQEARKCYAEPINLNAAQFIEMMVLDGCFIIELVQKYKMKELREEDDPIFKNDGMMWMRNRLRHDLMLFENQIPFFVLCKLYDLIEVPNYHKKLMSLVLLFLKNSSRGKGYRLSIERSSNQIKHLLELIHISWLPPFDWPNFTDEHSNDRSKLYRFIYSATKLKEANMKFEKNEEAALLFDVSFKSGSMKFPPLTIDDGTESYFRNLIAYEQYFVASKYSVFTNYVILLDCLIDSSKDVEILCHHGILNNLLGNCQVVSDIFLKLNDSVTVGEFTYAKTFKDVNDHCNKRRNRWMAKLRTNYCNSPWATISVIGVTVLLLLAIIQTVCSILQVV